MRNYLTFDGEDLRDCGVYISGAGVYDAPARVYDEIEIPGRNGTLLGYEHRLENIELTYPAFMYADFRNNIAALKGILLSRIGYKELTDTYYPEEFRLAAYAGGLEVEATQALTAGRFELKFNCKPQRFLNSGKVPVTFLSAGTLENPTDFPSSPWMRVYGTGTVTINGVTITITECDAYTDIDCDIMEAYKGTASKNEFIEISGVDFPTLSPGTNQIGMTGSVTEIYIKPRWWRL